MFLLLVLPFLSVLINAQIQSPLASPEALQDRELQISFTGDSRYCDNAVGRQPTYQLFSLYNNLTKSLFSVESLHHAFHLLSFSPNLAILISGTANNLI